jgi:hypothetical protein
MKPAVAMTLGAGAFTVILGGYLIAYATTVREPVAWKTGDLIVQDSTVEGMLPVFAADGSGMTHIGLVDVTADNGAVVIEVTDTVRETPMRDFIARGKDKAIAVYRLEALSDAQRSATVMAARRQLGKPSDYYLRRSWDAFYSSELVHLAYGDIGFDLGRMQKISAIAKDLTSIRSAFGRNWGDDKDCVKRNFDSEQCWAMVEKQEIITPASIVGDSQMTKVYSSMTQVAAK